MKTPIYNLYASKRQVQDRLQRPYVNGSIERYDEDVSTSSKPQRNEVCSRVTTLEKIIYFIAGAILTAIFYRH
jgi:hypothetical protein